MTNTEATPAAVTAPRSLAATPPVPPAADTPPGGPVRRSTTSVLVPLAVSVTVLLWASAFIGIRAAGHDYSPGALTLGRVSIAAVALTMIAGVSGKIRIPRGRILVGVLIWGAIWFGLYNITLNAAERVLDAGTASLLVQTAPIITTVVAGLMLGEGFPARLLTGVGIAFVGVAVIAWASSSGTSNVVAVLLGLASAALYSTGAIMQKRMLPGLNVLTMTWLGCIVGTVVTLPFAGTLFREIAAAPTSATLAMVYLGAFPTAVAFVTWGYALSHTTAGRLSATTYFIPPITVLLSWLLLGEVPALIALAGGALCICGVIVATRKSRK